MLHWIDTHGILVGIVWWVFAAAVDQMPAATASSSPFYKWAYGFLHTIMQTAAANLSRVPGLGKLFSSGQGVQP